MQIYWNIVRNNSDSAIYNSNSAGVSIHESAIYGKLRGITTSHRNRTSATASDSSGNGNTAPLVNGPVFSAGKISNALSFDGINDYASAADSASLESGSVTIALWLYMPASLNGSTGNNWRSLIRKGSTLPTTTGWDIILEENNGFSRDISDGAATKRLSAPARTSWFLSQWEHFAFTYDAVTGVQAIFKNGASISQTTPVPAVPIAVNASPVDIARGTNAVSCPTQNGYLPALLDDVRICTRVLSASEAHLRQAKKSPGTFGALVG